MRTGPLVLTVALLLGIYGVTASLSIEQPGVNYDELIHVNAALGGLDKTFVNRSWQDIPILLMPYVGALKSYLTAPIFALYGVSATTVRLPVILMTVVALGVLFLALTRLFSQRLALLTLLLLVVDPSFLVQTRFDYGFVVLGFLAKAAALLALNNLLRSRKPIHLLWIFVSLACGLFNKLDFIWFVNGFLAGSCLFYGKELRALVAERRGFVRAAMLGGSALGVVLLLGAFLLGMKSMLSSEPAVPTDDPVLPRTVFGDFAQQLNGELFFNQPQCFGYFHPPLGGIVATLLLSLLGIGFVLTVLDGGRRLAARREAFFITFLLATTLLQIALTRSAVSSWHMFTTYPMVSVLLAYSLYAVYAWIPAGFGKAGRAILGLLVVVLLAYQGRTYAHYLRTFDAPMKNVLWSSKINELIDYTRDETSRFASVDWGTHIQLLTFTGQRDKFYNLSFALNGELPLEVRDQLFTTYLKPSRGFRFIVHPEDKTSFTMARAYLFAVAEERGCTLEVEHEILDGDQVVFQVMKSTRAP